MLALVTLLAAVLACTSSEITCDAYEIPPATLDANILDLCTQMSGMPGCALQGKVAKFQVYATICIDMPSMKGCADYKAQCQGGNVQCSKNPPIAVPSSSTVTKQIYSICNEMNMDGCEVCKISNANTSYSECNLLGTYAKLCTSMPDMSQCSAFKSMCSATDLDYCTTTTVPSMKMYFHNDIANYVLFRDWIPRTTAQYWGAWFACFFGAVLYESLQVLNAFLELAWAPVATVDSKGIIFGSDFSRPSPSVWSHICGMSQGRRGIVNAALRGGMRFITATLSYALMLIAMTFNVGLFFAVITGFAVGNFVFGPMIKLHLHSLGLIEFPHSQDCH